MCCVSSQCSFSITTWSFGSSLPFGSTSLPFGLSKLWGATPHMLWNARAAVLCAACPGELLPGICPRSVSPTRSKPPKSPSTSVLGFPRVHFLDVLPGAFLFGSSSIHLAGAVHLDSLALFFINVVFVTSSTCQGPGALPLPVISGSPLNRTLRVE